MPTHLLVDTFSFAFSVTAPVFLMVVLGIGLKRSNMIDDAFISTASKLVFNIGLPTLLFISSATTDFTQLADIRLLIAMLSMTLIVFVITQITADWHLTEQRDRGVFVQGAFRGNLVITGLAFCANAYGERGLAIAALPVAATVIIYNLFSVYTLTRSLHTQENGWLRGTLKGVIRNPLLIAIAAGLLVNTVQLPIPEILRSSAGYLGQMVLPLALLCIGGALDLKQLRSIDRTALAASIWKLLLSPVIACAIAMALGVRGENLAILFLLSASSTATVSFVMVQAMGGNAKLAANIIVQTTLGSMITITLGLWLLQGMGWV